VYIDAIAARSRETRV